MVGRSFKSLISNKNFSSFKNDVVQLPPSTKCNSATQESTQKNHHNLNEFLKLRKYNKKWIHYKTLQKTHHPKDG